MIRLNGSEFVFRPGVSLKELMDEYNTVYSKSLAFDGFVTMVNNTCLNEQQARERVLQDDDRILIIPIIDGG